MTEEEEKIWKDGGWMPKCATCALDIPCDCMNCSEMEITLLKRRQFHLFDVKTHTALCGMREPMLATETIQVTCSKCWANFRGLNQTKKGVFEQQKIMRYAGLDASNLSKVIAFVNNPKNDPSERG